ncbi:uncharacterized protein LOC133806071 [Humulus lupulus]|uniref:uncharacterized protein LOC133806071 n=1 Tax=Humulus lupulus TaxID=3486 RepID=UPI002B411E87|nr:uncharacterized protein LOC133806071 [Humulus lupulus]
MPSVQPAAPATQSVNLAAEVARLREQLRLRDKALAHARKQAPPTFEGKIDPIVAEDWLRSVEAIFDHMELNDRQRVSCAVYLLKMDARIWWHTFSKKYYSAALLATNVDEFVTLVQGNLFVTNYAQKFNRLEKFAPEVVPTETLRAQRFIRGLKPMITRDVMMTSVELVSYAEVLDRELEAEYLEDRIWKDNAARRENY